MTDSAVLRKAIAATEVTWGRIAVSIAAGTMALGSAVGLAAVAAWLIATAAQMPSPADVALAAVIVRFFGISRGLFRYLERLASHDTALRGMATLRASTYDRLAAAGTARVLSLRRGDLLARVGTDMDDVGDLIVRGIVPTGVAVTVSLVSIGIVGWLSPLAGVALALCLIAAAVLPALLTARSVRVSESAGSVARARVSVAVHSVMDGASEHLVWGTGAAAMEELRAAGRAEVDAHDAAARPAALAAALQATFSGLALLACVWIAVAGARSGDLTAPAAAIVALTPLAAFEAVGAIPGAVTQYFRSLAAARRIEEMVDVAPATSTVTTPPPSPSATHSAGQPGVSRETRRESSPDAQNVLLTEGEGGEHTEGGRGGAGAFARQLTLTDLSASRPGMTPTAQISATLSPGESLALVGRSGIGKTTLLLTIAGALAPHAGTATLSGRFITPADTGHAVALTLEDAHLFGTTVLENLRVADGAATQDQAREALDLVGLGAWVDGLPHGMETMLGSGGNSVSGGERRRLLLARAVLSDAPVHLIDEPAEHLDGTGAEALAQVLALMAERGQIVILVTHDRSLLPLVTSWVDVRAADS